MPPKKGKKGKKKKVLIGGTAFETHLGQALLERVGLDQSTEYSEGGGDTSYMSHETPRSNEPTEGDEGTVVKTASSMQVDGREEMKEGEEKIGQEMVEQ